MLEPVQYQPKSSYTPQTNTARTPIPSAASLPVVALSSVVYNPAQDSQSLQHAPQPLQYDLPLPQYSAPAIPYRSSPRLGHQQAIYTAYPPDPALRHDLSYSQHPQTFENTSFQMPPSMPPPVSVSTVSTVLPVPLSMYVSNPYPGNSAFGPFSPQTPQTPHPGQTITSPTARSTAQLPPYSQVYPPPQQSHAQGYGYAPPPTWTPTGFP